MKPSAVDIDLRRRQVMAILNVTPDSFFAGSRTADEDAIARRVREAVGAGCSIIDVGGYSSRPGAAEVSPEQEWLRVKRGVATVRRLAPGMAVSVDTFRSEVVERVVERFGAVIVNDISAGELDPRMCAVVARHDLPYVAMHMRGTPASMQEMTAYRNVAEEVAGYFREKTAALEAAGVRRDRIVLDPGFGFAKTLEQNYELLAGLNRIRALGYPLLAGVSRKSMIYRLLGTTPDRALAGTVALGWECLRQGASILRVHDVQEAVDTVKLFETYTRYLG